MNRFGSTRAQASRRLIQQLAGTRLLDRPVVSSPGQIVSWWESRRMLFNLLVGGVGLMGCLVMLVCGVESESVWLAGLCSAVLANVCYTLGWLVELSIRSASPGRHSDFARTWFVLGTGIWMLLACVPPIGVVALSIVRHMMHLGLV